MTWIYEFPTWLFMSAVTIIACALACVVLAIARKRFIRPDLITHNDVAGAILSTIGTLLAVMLAFMLLGVWQEYDAAADTVLHEAVALSDLHHLADAFSEPMRTRLHGTVDQYLRLVISQDWPSMREGGESNAAHFAGYRVESLIEHYQPKDATDSLLQQHALALAEQFLDARRERLHANQQGIPAIMWAATFFFSVVTVGFAFYFRVDRPRAQFIMVGALAAVIALMCTVIAELDYPFRGDTSISDDIFVRTLQGLHTEQNQPI